MTADALPDTLTAYLEDGEAAPAARPAPRRAVVALPDLPPLMADHGYPVSGDEIARTLYDRHPQNVSVRGRALSRVPLGDLLTPRLLDQAHAGRR